MNAKTLVAIDIAMEDLDKAGAMALISAHHVNHSQLGPVKST